MESASFSGSSFQRVSFCRGLLWQASLFWLLLCGLLWHVEAELSRGLLQGDLQHHRLVPQHLRRLASLLPHLQISSEDKRMKRKSYQVADGEAEVYCVPHKKCSRHSNYNLRHRKMYFLWENKEKRKKKFFRLKCISNPSFIFIYKTTLSCHFEA